MSFLTSKLTVHADKTYVTPPNCEFVSRIPLFVDDKRMLLAWCHLSVEEYPTRIGQLWSCNAFLHV